MADLIAQGPDFSQRWRKPLPEDRPVIIGRQAGTWSVPWDEHISREHVRLTWNNKRLHVEQLPAARNPVFVEGRVARTIRLKAGEHFVIGNTTFSLSDNRVEVTVDARKPDREQSFTSADLERLAFRDAPRRIELLSRLPHVIEGAVSDEELFVRLVNLLLMAIPRADAAAVVELDPQDQAATARVLHWDRRRLEGDFQPSRRLIARAVTTGETTAHTWEAAESASEFTSTESVDWAFCTPLRGAACRGWALYLAGRSNPDAPTGSGRSELLDLRDDMKFTEIAAATLGSLRELRRLGQQQAGLRQFFSPVVMEALGADDPERILAPREAEVSVLFCDLRGFSRTSERGSADLFDVLERVSKALGVMTRAILEHGGVVGDFQGDAAMGFWGWPLAEPDAPLRAARAALTIRAEFETASRQSQNRLSGFRVGVGIATGRAVAGKIGTADQVKVTVFGPVANVAARLESMTRLVNAPILVDGPTAEFLGSRLTVSEARLRRVARVRPYGFETAVDVSELVSSAPEPDGLTDANLRVHEAALEAFTAGRWPEADKLLAGLPKNDGAGGFLRSFIAQHNHAPPSGWSGVIALASK